MPRTIESETGIPRKTVIAAALIAAMGLATAGPLMLSNRPARAQDAKPTTAPEADAAPLYVAAMKIVADNDANNIMCPAASNFDYTPYPPFSEQWTKAEGDAFPANAEARKLAHEARSIDHAQWPTDAQIAAQPELRYLNGCRNLANELGDAALWQHVHGDDAAAVETLRDLFHLADVTYDADHPQMVSLLVSVGIRETALERLNVLASTAVFTKEPVHNKGVDVKISRDLIAVLLGGQPHLFHLTGADRSEFMRREQLPADTMEKFERVGRHVEAESDMAAVSLACHLFKFDTGHWPASVADLKPYLSVVPIDPGGDGKQTIGYAVIKGGLTDGGDRPLVYSRAGAKGDLFYRAEEPAYGYYINRYPAGAVIPADRGGQFRDVEGWAPADRSLVGPTTRPLE